MATCKQTDRQTDRQTDIHTFYNAVTPVWGSLRLASKKKLTDAENECTSTRDYN